MNLLKPLNGISWYFYGFQCFVQCSASLPFCLQSVATSIYVYMWFILCIINIVMLFWLHPPSPNEKNIFSRVCEPALPYLATVTNQGGRRITHLLPPKHVKSLNCIFLICCSCCITGQRNTFEKRETLSALFLIQFVDGLVSQGLTGDRESMMPLPPRDHGQCCSLSSWPLMTRSFP